ncbi:MAG: stage 0 sporulation protein [Clostridia bacterium]|nr:stage 0 sporulation protein [Clostridia bacterium]
MANSLDDYLEKAPEEAEGAKEKRDPEAPVTVVGLRFRRAGKTYYFDPGELTVKAGDSVIVETARGLELAEAAAGNTVVREREVIRPLRPVLRVATEADKKHDAENRQKEAKACEICRKKIEESGLEMSLIDAEYTFDNNKLLFYFTAEGRVDFRELVKELASIFRTRIELRQVGIRDEAKLMGGLGVCGRPFCCHSFLSEFVQVSIKMAKEQNFSLNSSKVSGACGRLMCCLRYEHDVYDEEIKKTPAVGSLVEVPGGKGIITEVNPLVGQVRVKLEEKPESPKYYSRDDVKVLMTAKQRKAENAAKNAPRQKQKKTGGEEKTAENQVEILTRPNVEEAGEI